MRMKKNREGYAILTIMFVISALTLTIASTFKVAENRNQTIRLLAQNTRALAYAEACDDLAVAILDTDFDARHDPSAFTVVNGETNETASTQSSDGLYSLALANNDGGTTTSYDNGSFTIDIVPVSNRYVIVKVKGDCGDVSKDVEVVFEDLNAGMTGTPGTPSIDGTAWEKTLFAAGQMNLGGNGDIDGSLHANGQLRLNGNVEIEPSEVHMSSATKIRINGNVKADGTFTAPVISVNGNKESNATFTKTAVDPIAFPEYALSELYQTAFDNGQVIDGNYKKSKDINWKNIPGGVVWVNGYVKINGNANLDCTVVATGYINITGNCNWDESYENQNHIISRDSTIKVAGNTEVNGLLYAASDITISGNARVYGQVISGKDVAINGNVDVINYVYSGSTSGTDGTDPLAPDVEVSAWQK